MLKTEKLRNNILSHKEELISGAEIFDILWNSCRLEMILALIQADELSSGEIVQVTHCTPSAVSQALAMMKMGRMVTARRGGRNIYYALNRSNTIVKKLYPLLLYFLGDDFSEGD